MKPKTKKTQRTPIRKVETIANEKLALASGGRSPIRPVAACNFGTAIGDQVNAGSKVFSDVNGSGRRVVQGTDQLFYPVWTDKKGNAVSQGRGSESMTDAFKRNGHWLMPKPH